MDKINKKSIKSCLQILTVLVFGLVFIPLHTTLAAYGSNIGGDNNYHAVEENNPVPSITSINPNNGIKGEVTKIITITGNNFIPNSVARVNGSNRATTFIDYSHLLIQLNANDMNRTDGFFITVFNGLPVGGYSNGIFFTLKNRTPATTTSNTTYTTNSTNNNSSTNGTNNTSVNTSTNTSTDTTQNTTSNTDTDSKYSDLASNVIFGTNSFMPSGLVQWVILAIIILIIVILARKVFGLKEEYDEIPMKHS